MWGAEAIQFCTRTVHNILYGCIEYTAVQIVCLHLAQFLLIETLDIIKLPVL